MNSLDFLVIGAQKCATTTLFELLRQHPQIAMPIEKEVPVFTEGDVDDATLQRFVSSHIPDAAGKLCGKVTPQYMAHASVPQRIARALPDCRLIAVLRDPLERAHSHYRMAQRRGTESRDFAAAMAPLLDSDALAQGRRDKPPTHETGYESEAAFYLAWSEYGRILERYRRYFPSAQLLVIHSEDLQSDPRRSLDRVLEFLGAAPDFQPRGLGQHMHRGGGNRIPHGARVWLRERGVVRSLWRCIPAQQQGRLRFLYERWNTVAQSAAPELPAALEARLRAHLAADLAILQRLSIAKPPWAAKYRIATSMAAAA